MGYVDLFCGPGKYNDNKPTTPIQIIQSTLQDPTLRKRMYFLFNDNNPENIEALKKFISEVDTLDALRGRISYNTQTVDNHIGNQIKIPSAMPILSFVDPFGYKGITIELVNKLIKNPGSDCIFFFNYNRINMALSSNTKFDEHLKDLFGSMRMDTLKQALSRLPSAQREPMVLRALTEALTENRANYVLPFKFYSTEILRTSHYIIFVTKHPTACQIMKQIMYTNSAKDQDGIATFSFKDSHNFSSSYEQMTLFDTPLKTLQTKLLRDYSGAQVSVKSICALIENDFSNHYVSKNVKDALKKLECTGKLTVVSGRTQKMRNGELTMPDNAIIKFNQ